jgi:peptidoglycan hydrolase-like protein with peptidoglycan-binding domain
MAKRKSKSAASKRFPGGSRTKTTDTGKRGRPYTSPAADLARNDSGPQVERLQSFLAKFGYIQSPSLATFGVPDRLAAAPPPTGTFEENTSQALKQYQAFHGLPATGEMDDATATMMAQPRCGFPDVVPRSASVAEFTVEGRKWNKTALTYTFLNFTADLTNAQIRAAVQQAFALWIEERTLPSGQRTSLADDIEADPTRPLIVDAFWFDTHEGTGVIVRGFGIAATTVTLDLTWYDSAGVVRAKSHRIGSAGWSDPSFGQHDIRRPPRLQEVWIPFDRSDLLAQFWLHLRARASTGALSPIYSDYYN